MIGVAARPDGIDNRQLAHAGQIANEETERERERGGGGRDHVR